MDESIIYGISSMNRVTLKGSLLISKKQRRKKSRVSLLDHFII